MVPQNQKKIPFTLPKGTLTLPTKQLFLKVLYNVCQIKKKRHKLEQYYRLHIEGPNFAVCETISATVLVLNSAFTTKDNYFQVGLDDAIDAFNATLVDFGCTQKLHRYNPDTHQIHTTSNHPF